MEDVDSNIPKTYLTRKGALVLYASDDKSHDTISDKTSTLHGHDSDTHNVAQVLQQLGNVRRLVESVLCMTDNTQVRYLLL